ncbi:hypothetical protein [Rhizobium sp. 18055]|uniref:hypothetical protein n=1 Tax=Rhizobium sp. 18055 TaxID=2681403 RepID=UPI001359CA41|nr:hypothetical protein [Rhizobium sp. 18055]
MRSLSLYLGLAVLAVAISAAELKAEPLTETLVFIRHGEKPQAGLGQLSCKGLNRALALPAVIKAGFGKPDAIFAPDPSVRKEDGGTSYDYIRPLATVEPTAIAFGLPVDTSFGYEDIAGLQAALGKPEYWKATVLIAWEHRQITVLSRQILGANGGDADQVPKWKGKDFDSISVIRIVRDGDKTTASFERRKEMLDGQSDTCPGATK